MEQIQQLFSDPEMVSFMLQCAIIVILMLIFT
jgi:hypothetical protein